MLCQGSLPWAIIVAGASGVAVEPGILPGGNASLRSNDCKGLVFVRLYPGGGTPALYGGPEARLYNSGLRHPALPCPVG